MQPIVTEREYFLFNCISSREAYFEAKLFPMDNLYFSIGQPITAEAGNYFLVKITFCRRWSFPFGNYHNGEGSTTEIKVAKLTYSRRAVQKSALFGNVAVQKQDGFTLHMTISEVT